MNCGIGDTVEVFCRFCPWSSQNKYMVVDSIVSTQFPRVGKTDGWVKAEIVDRADCDPKSLLVSTKPTEEQPWVKIRFADILWTDKFGHLLHEKSLFQWLPLASVRSPTSVPEKTTTLFVVRWGGTVPVDENRFDFALSDKLIQELMDAVHLELEELEIQTVWVSGSSDLAKISLPKVRNFSKTFAMYFLWGSNNDQKPGYVFSADLLALMRSMETHGIVTKYPNHAELYSLITSKIYQPLLCTNPLLAIPPTVMVPVSKFLHNPACILTTGIAEGVVKVGGTWMGEGVRAFDGASDLQSKAQSLLEQGGIVDALIVQKRIADIVCEPRVFLFNGEIKQIRYTWNEKIDANTGRIYGLRTCPQARAATELFNGDSEAQLLVEIRIAELVEAWKLWLLAVTGELPVFVRIDFLVQGPSHTVWTCELGEIGSSMVGFKEGKEMLFTEIAKSCKPRRPNRPPPQL